jgi:hypothetical protein
MTPLPPCASMACSAYSFTFTTTSILDAFKITYFVHTLINTIHVRWVPCHHSMARPQVADREKYLQICRAAENIFNKQSRRAEKG